MFETRISLRSPLSHEYAGEIERRVFFISSDIVDFSLTERDGRICDVVLRSARSLDQDALGDAVNLLIENDVATQRLTPPKVVWESPARRDADADTFLRLVQDGIVEEVAEGQVILGESAISLMNYFDSALRGIAVRALGAREYQYPTLIPTPTLEATGYFTSFPHFLMFVTRLHSDIETYRAFQSQYRQHGHLDTSALRLCDSVDYCLPPTMCFHTFGQYRGRTLDAGRTHVVTSKGKSFRFESRYATSLERLWDFTIREIVFMGPRQQVLDMRERVMAAVFALVSELGLAGRCEVGNDPFFGSPDTPERITSQRLMELKYELRLDVAPGRTVAAGSFNFHGDFFGDSFHITQGGGDAVSSGCVGFGLERLVYAFLCQYGVDPVDWPPAVSRRIGDIGER